MHSPPSNTLGIVRRYRTILIGIPVIMALALAATATVSIRHVLSVRDNVARGEAHAFFNELRSLQPREAVNDPKVLDAMIAEKWDDGLRCIAVFDAQQNLVFRCGNCASSESDLRSALQRHEPGHMERIGDRIRYGTPRPPEKLLNLEKASLPPQLVIEYIPVKAKELLRGSIRALVLGVAASLALIAATIAVVGLARGTELLQRQAEQDRHLAALGQVAAVISHQLRNPLTSMKGHAQLLAEMLPHGSRERGKADRVVGEALRLEHLTTDLLDFVRSRQVVLARTDAGKLLIRACETLDPQRITAGVPETPLTWQLDAVKLEQALVNLLENALQLSEGPVEAHVCEKDSALWFTVRDHGPGIPDGDETRLFEPFHTTRTRGTGLGLAIAQGIVEAHGGTLTAENHPDGGALMSIRLPKKER